MIIDELNKLINALEISVETVTVDSVRTEIRKQMAALHPDHNGGSFTSSGNESRYHRLRDALESLDNASPPAQMVMTSPNTELMPIEKKLQIISDIQLATLERTSSKEYIDSTKKEARAKYGSAKIGSAIFGSICGAILAMSNLPKDNPLFVSVAPEYYFLKVLLLKSAFLMSAVLFLFYWLKEYRASRYVEWLMSDHGISTILRRAVQYANSNNEESSVTKSMLKNEILSINRPWAKSPQFRWLKQLFKPQLSTTLAEDIAERHLQRLAQTEVISSRGRKGIETIYVVDENVVKDLKEGHYYADEY